MALSDATLLWSGTSTSNVTSLASGNISPSANALLIIALGVLKASAPAPTITGASTTLSGIGSWTVRANVSGSASNVQEQAFITAQAGATPGTGTVTATWTNASNVNTMSVYEVTGHNTTTPVAQEKTGTGTSASPSITLDSTPTSTSLVLGLVCSRADSGGITPGANYTELADILADGPVDLAHEVEFDRTSATTTVNWSDATTSNNTMGAIEIAEASGEVTVKPWYAYAQQ